MEQPTHICKVAGDSCHLGKKICCHFCEDFDECTGSCGEDYVADDCPDLEDNCHA